MKELLGLASCTLLAIVVIAGIVGTLGLFWHRRYGITFPPPALAVFATVLMCCLMAALSGLARSGRVPWLRGILQELELFVVACNIVFAWTLVKLDAFLRRDRHV